MSGRKQSRAEIERERQKELERQRQERLRQIRLATDQYNAVINKYESFRTSVSLSMKNEIAAIKPVAELSMACDAFDQIKNVVNGKISEQTAAKLPSEPPAINALTAELRQNLTSLEKFYKSGLSDFSDRLNIYHKGQAELSQNLAFAKTLSKIERQQKVNYQDMTFDLSQLSPKLDEVQNEDYSAIYDDILEECTIIINDNAIAAAERSQLLKILNELQENADNPQASSAAIHQYKLLRGTAKNNINIFNELYNQYTALFVQFSDLRKNSKTPATITPKEKFESAAALEAEMRQLDENIKAEIKRAYIKQQLDEVMQKFQYSTGETIVMRGVTKGENLLFESGEQTVQVFISDKNQIMFEPIGLTGLAGEPSGYNADFSEEISESAKDAIFEDQQKFCSTWPQIVAELKLRGVIFGDIKVKEANRSTVRQIAVAGKHSKYSEKRRQTAQEQQLMSMQNRR
ncbi:MAG: hypothetical protein FWG64_05280 [Firmicutes bacterium]|nr:hypothetical protein [Bacillota bacterium]